MSGWDLNSLTNPDPLHDQINHYYFNLPGSNSFTLTATLIWLRPHSTFSAHAGINDLNLFFYNTANGNLILCSTSAVDNVEHLYMSVPAAGALRFAGAEKCAGQVSPGETYALVFEFFNVPLSISPTNRNVVISWPLAPAGFQLQSTTKFEPARGRSPVASAGVGGHECESRMSWPFPSPARNQFFRLQTSA